MRRRLRSKPQKFERQTVKVMHRLQPVRPPRQRSTLRRTASLLFPKLEHPSVAKVRQVICRIDRKRSRRPVDPVFGTFQFREHAKRGLVDDAVSRIVGPFGPILFVDERWNKSQRSKDRRNRLAIPDRGFGFDPLLVRPVSPSAGIALCVSTHFSPYCRMRRI